MMIQRLAALAFGMIAAIALAEAVARFVEKPAFGPEVRFDVTRGEVIIYQPHHHLSYSIAPNAPALLMRGPHNSLGFRGPEATQQKRGSYRIVCLGGSTTYGTRNEREEDCWPRKLEAKVRARRPRAEVINAGVPAYTSAESIQSLREQVLPLEPDVVILYISVNDVMPRFAPNFRSDYAHYRKTWRHPLDAPTDSGGGSALLKLFRDRAAPPKVQIALRALTCHGYDESIETEKAAWEASKPAAFKRNIRTLVDAAAGAGARVIVATQSIDTTRIAKDLPHARAAFFTQGLSEFSAAIAEVAADRGAVLVDLEKLVRNPAAFEDFSHHNAAGAEQIALHLAAAIK